MDFVGLGGLEQLFWLGSFFSFFLGVARGLRVEDPGPYPIRGSLPYKVRWGALVSSISIDEFEGCF